ncbi:hypothetical protein MmiEs2_04440 [Methanimicrococcus stummii]|uniref:DUF4276 family protein n=1 Tax=Methanimicrococcus stummii TaxID=3028294 RepID=A0AA96V9S2_9EURY|nr:DUF4276 family protein [Methanimicrococcus sp. Es2]WNY28260.1 hypothetical protein MmiEs2_04440 [Methanimicrococcus sp. Es2]
MTRLYIYCEGQTEERFVTSLLRDHLSVYDITVIPIVAETKRTSTRKFSGGISSYSKIRKELLNLCNEHPREWVTSMIDYYAFPNDAPFSLTFSGNIYDGITGIETEFSTDIGKTNFLPHLMLHEFESLLFSDVNAFSTHYTKSADLSKISALNLIRSQHRTPEHIDNGPTTAPSKRIMSHFNDYGYAKPVIGNNVAKVIGLPKLRNECCHFHEWICKLEKL